MYSTAWWNALLVTQICVMHTDLIFFFLHLHSRECRCVLRREVCKNLRMCCCCYCYSYYYWWPCPGSIPGAGHLSRYVTCHPGQLSLAIPSWVGTVSTSQGAVTPCVWGVKVAMVRVCVAGKTVWSPCYTRVFQMSEMFLSICQQCSLTPYN